VKVESRSDTPQASWRRVGWTYDALGRRIRQITSVWTNNAWAVVEDLKFISDPLLFGRHIAELNASDNALVRTYVWGLDLSGMEQGAGGVGGLLMFTHHGSPVATHFSAYDGNGNVVVLVSASDGSPTAHYEYGPFGEPLRVTGPAAALNPFRFSSKRTDPTTDLVLYEYRAYSPTLGRWLSRDRTGEQGGLNLHAFVSNSPMDLIDPNGDAVWWDCVACGAALIGKFGGLLAGCIWGCAESSSPLYPFGQCMNDCLTKQFSACELWKSFKGNPAEWVGAAACVTCGVHAIVEVMKGPPPGCEGCQWETCHCFCPSGAYFAYMVVAGAPCRPVRMPIYGWQVTPEGIPIYGPIGEETCPCAKM